MRVQYPTVMDDIIVNPWRAWSVSADRVPAAVLAIADEVIE